MSEEKSLGAFKPPVKVHINAMLRIFRYNLDSNYWAQRQEYHQSCIWAFSRSKSDLKK